MGKRRKPKPYRGLHNLMQRRSQFRCPGPPPRVREGAHMQGRVRSRLPAEEPPPPYEHRHRRNRDREKLLVFLEELKKRWYYGPPRAIRRAAEASIGDWSSELSKRYRMHPVRPETAVSLTTNSTWLNLQRTIYTNESVDATTSTYGNW